jgi:3-deoxy-7-phosphoheptulonate synthase / chorismate mutase
MRRDWMMLEELRSKVDKLNLEILKLLNERAEVVKDIGSIKESQGTQRFDPVREKQMLNELVDNNHGPFSDENVKYLFKKIFQLSLGLQEKEQKKVLLVHRQPNKENTVIEVGNEKIGGGSPVLLAGPCSVESEEQMEAVASHLSAKGVKWLRGGAYKPRTSPYDFQGLGFDGLKLMKRVASKHGLRVVTEIMQPADVEKAVDHLDVIQIGARNMQNFDLLKEAGKANVPVMLKRGFAATLAEYLHAAEYIMYHGNEQIILCERGIRTFEKAVRNNIDISAIPLLKQDSHLPIIVDVAHSGRKDILVPLAKAALAAGADGIMVETHNNPSVALSDAGQQLDLNEFDIFLDEIGAFMKKFELTLI